MGDAGIPQLLVRDKWLVRGMQFEMKATVEPVAGGVSLGLRSGASKQSGAWEPVSGQKAAE